MEINRPRYRGDHKVRVYVPVAMRGIGSLEGIIVHLGVHDFNSNTY